jgi:HD-GYP domain-containing protein (c-di-GMP phosphodiesterase class II)
MQNHQGKELRRSYWRGYMNVQMLQIKNELLVASSELDQMVECLTCALALRDSETVEHTRRVTAMTLILAQAVDIPAGGLIHIRRGAMLHDLGKIGIPDFILWKETSLTRAERDMMQMHPVYAYELLSTIPGLQPALDIPYCHHEKWDGTGYPRGLRNDQIPLAARLFSIVDVWDALVSDRPYRPAWSVNQACEYIQEQSGKHFDSEIVKKFFQFCSTK